MIYSVKELKSPEILSAFRFDLIKQEVAKQWEERRRVNELGYIDLADKERILHHYQAVKPLLFEGYAQDFPDDPMTPRMMNTWIRQSAIAFGNMKDMPTRNIWLDLRECFLLLWQHDLLEVDEHGVLQ